eukprot:6198649-Pleurochrysis_carterae.AAC.1
MRPTAPSCRQATLRRASPPLLLRFQVSGREQQDHRLRDERVSHLRLHASRMVRRDPRPPVSSALSQASRRPSAKRLVGPQPSVSSALSQASRRPSAKRLVGPSACTPRRSGARVAAPAPELLLAESLPLDALACFSSSSIASCVRAAAAECAVERSARVGASLFPPFPMVLGAPVRGGRWCAQNNRTRFDPSRAELEQLRNVFFKALAAIRPLVLRIP